jgi:hypothetical protein
MEQRGQSQARLSYAESRQSSRNSNRFSYAEHTQTRRSQVCGEIAISFNSQNNDMMTGGAQARLRPSLIPLFPRDIKDEKRNEGKREEPLKT